GTTSPTTVAAVRTTPGSGSSAAPPATKQYVDAAVASKANDSAVVHLSGAETIIGTKQFAVARACRPRAERRCGEQSLCGCGRDHFRQRALRQQIRRHNDWSAAIAGRSGCAEPGSGQ